MLIGRELLAKMKHKEKFVLAGKMIMGTDGQPMSKTSGNCIWLTDSAEDMFAKLMAVRDELMPDYWEFFTDKNMPKGEPLAVKKLLALEITNQYRGLAKAKEAQKSFEQTFQKREPEYKETIKAKANLMLTVASLVGSNSEAKRLINQGAIDVNSQKIGDSNLKLKAGDNLKIGQRIFVKIK
jgi:tyrosyl-tRNA synthetase